MQPPSSQRALRGSTSQRLQPDKQPSASRSVQGKRRSAEDMESTEAAAAGAWEEGGSEEREEEDASALRPFTCCREAALRMATRLTQSPPPHRSSHSHFLTFSSQLKVEDHTRPAHPPRGLGASCHHVVM